MKTLVRTALIIGVAACAARPAEYRSRAGDPELLHAAVHDINNVIVYDIFNPPQAARVYAYASIAAYETARSSDPRQLSLGGQLNGLSAVPAPDSSLDYDLSLASVHAFFTVARAMTFSRDRVDSMRLAAVDKVRARTSKAVFERSIAYGDSVARHILAWAAKDHYLETRGYPKYTVTSEPGRWRPTPPAYMDALEPHWAEVRSFTLDSASQFKPPPPYRYDMTPGSPFSRDAHEVLSVGRSLTDEQRQIVVHWDDNPYVMHVQGHTMFATKKVTPGGHWMGIVGVAARKANAGFVRSAEAYALAAIALADGFISCWDEKFRSNLIRPETVINASLDERWQPMLQTPPFPEYPSGHSVISSATAVVLTNLFGDNFAFHDDVEKEFGLPARDFTSFREAADQAGMSRLYGGIHYRRGVEQGLAQGRRVGEHIVRRIRTRAPDSTTATAATSF
jgi:hypothetical protein